MTSEDYKKKIAQLEQRIAELEGEEKTEIYAIELKRKNEFIQTVLDHIPIGVALNKFESGHATYMNKKFTEIYGWSEEELTDISAFFEKVMPDEKYRNYIIDRITTDIQTGDPEKMHWEGIEITRKSGEKRIVNAVNIPLIEQDTMVSTVMDVTDLKKYEQKLLHANEKLMESDRLKTVFLQNMSHEIRTPMNAIVGFSNLLKTKKFNADRQNYFINIIERSSQQLLDVVSDVITISSIETKQEELKLSKVKISDVFEDLIDKFTLLAQEKGIVLEVLKKKNNPDFEIISDELKIVRILSNLLSNSIKFTHSGKIEFGYDLKESGDRPVIEFFVTDSGIGIKEDQINIIFQQFRQGDNSSNRKYGGTGLGLSIVKGFVNLLDGEIEVNTKLNVGTEFKVRIPFIRADNNASPENIMHMNRSLFDSPYTILIVDDESFNFVFLEEVLKDTNYLLIEAKNGFEAIKMCETNPDIDLVLMDIKMPGMDGYEATGVIKKMRPELPVIAQTAYAMDNEISHFIDVFDAYITKPINQSKLMHLVRDFLAVPDL